MIRRTHNILQWLFIVFLLYLLLTRLVISWVQVFPDNFLSVVQGLSGSSVQAEEISVSQDWLGFEFTAKNIVIEDEQYAFRADYLSFDFNTFFFVFPTIDYGESITVKKGYYQAKKSSSNETEQTNSLSIDEALKLDANINRLWRRVSIEDFVLSEMYPGMSVQVDRFKSLKSARLSMISEFSLSYKDVLDYEKFNLRTFFVPNVWGDVDYGELSFSSFKPLRIEKLTTLMPAKWQEVMPRGELIVDVDGRFADAQLADVDIKLNSQMLAWQQQHDGLPSSVGLNLEWGQDELDLSQSRNNWQFQLSKFQIDNRFIDAVSPVKLYFEEGGLIDFEAKRFDIEPLKVIVKALVEKQITPGIFDRAVNLSISDLSGKLDVESLSFPELAISFDRLDLPVTDYPGMSLRNFNIVKTPISLSISSPNPVWLMMPDIHDKPLRVDVPELLDLHFDEATKAWSQKDLKFQVNQIPVSIDLYQVNEHFIDAELNTKLVSMEQLKQYLPYSLMTTKLKSWLENGLVSSDQIDVVSRIKGRYQDFPFEKASHGLFEVNAKVKNAVLNFNSQWPLLRKFDADVLFKPYQITIKVPKVDIGSGNIADDVLVTIPGLNKSDIGLTVEGRVKTSLANSIRYLKNSPISNKIGIEEFLSSNVQFDGGSEVQIDRIWVPISGYENKDELVQGKVNLKGAGINLYGIAEFSDINGVLEFTESNISANNLSFSAMKGKGILNIKTSKKQKVVQLQAKGSLLGTKNPWFKKAVPWRGVLEIPFKSSKSKGLRFNGDFDVAKAQSKLPEPIDEQAIKNKSVKIRAGIRDQLLNVELSLDDILRSEVQWKESQGEYSLASLKAFLGSAVNTKIGNSFYSYIRGDIQKLDVSRWLSVYQSLPELGSVSGTESNQNLDWKASRVAIKELFYLSNRYPAVLATWQKNAEDKTVLNLDSKDLLGRVEFKGDQEIDASIEYIKLVTSKESQNDSQKSCAVEAESKVLPTINFFAKNLVVDGRKIEALSFKLKDSGDVLLAENISGLFGKKAGGLKGKYQYKKSTNNSRLELELNSKKVAEVARFLELNRGFSGKKGRVNADIGWQGGPQCYQLDAVSGNIRFRIDDGNIEDVEPGFARVIGLLSVESLLRRLRLDLKDVTNKGLVYDSIRGRAAINNSIVDISKLQLKAPSADGLITGAVDIKNETFDLKASITPKVGATVPTVAALAGNANPLVALAIYSVMKVIPGINENLVTYEYDVSGTWDNPEIKAKNQPETEQNILEPDSDSEDSILDLQ